MALWRQGMSPEAWADIFYTTFTTVRTAVITPIIMLVVFIVLRLAGQRSLTEQTLFNRWAAAHAAAAAVTPGQQFQTA
jgi:hypothetical protein